MPVTDWSDPSRIPLGFARGVSTPERMPDPRYIQANLFTLCQIGGAYDLLALYVEKDHLAILTEWRLDSGAPRVIDYLSHRDRVRSETRETREHA